MTIKDLIFELKKRCSFWLNNKTISKKHALECLLGILENEETQPSLPSNLDEAAEEWCKTNNKGIALSADKKSHYLVEGTDAFKAGAKWMSGQGASYNTKVGWIDGPTVLDWSDDILDKFEMGDDVIVQIRKKQ